jgi:hypothetical protein
VSRPLASDIVHGGCLALWSPRSAAAPSGWRGALIQGPSGAGKSDLALRLIEAGWSLVSDDRTLLWRSDGRLYGACPPAIAGLIEARGLGVLAQMALPMTRVDLVVRCGDALPERLPDPLFATLAGVATPVLVLNALEASAPAKLRRAMLSLGAGRQGAYLAPGGKSARGVPVKGRV